MCIYITKYVYTRRYLERVKQEATTSSLKCSALRCNPIANYRWQESSWVTLQTIRNTCSYNYTSEGNYRLEYFLENNETNWNNYINYYIQLDKHKMITYLRLQKV